MRLALARYQPYSLLGAELSHVVTVDPIQLLPDRRLRMDLVEGGVDVSLSGVAPDGPLRNAVSVTLEAHDGRTPGDLGWHPIPPAPGAPNPVWLSVTPPKVRPHLVHLVTAAARRLQGRPVHPD